MNIEEQRREDCVRVLTSMAELLIQNGNENQAGVIRVLAERISSGEPLAVLDTNDVWGGAGSVADCGFLKDVNPSNEMVCNESLFGDLVIRLVDLLDTTGFATNLMKSRRQSYLFWKSQREGNAIDP